MTATVPPPDLVTLITGVWPLAIIARLNVKLTCGEAPLTILDDVGFGQTSTFGGPVPTPQLDKLAAQGLRYNNFHTTAICGPSRAALITGRNHHNAGSGFLAE